MRPSRLNPIVILNRMEALRTENRQLAAFLETVIQCPPPLNVNVQDPPAGTIALIDLTGEIDANGNQNSETVTVADEPFDTDVESLPGSTEDGHQSCGITGICPSDTETSDSETASSEAEIPYIDLAESDDSSVIIPNPNVLEDVHVCVPSIDHLWIEIVCPAIFQYPFHKQDFSCLCCSQSF